MIWTTQQSLACTKARLARGQGRSAWTSDHCHLSPSPGPQPAPAAPCVHCSPASRDVAIGSSGRPSVSRRANVLASLQHSTASGAKSVICQTTTKQVGLRGVHKRHRTFGHASTNVAIRGTSTANATSPSPPVEFERSSPRPSMLHL